MRLTCEGFLQEYLVKLNLTTSDAYILRWFLSFTQSGNQEYIESDNKIYYWVKYSKVINDLPIIKIKNHVVVGNIFRRLCGQGQVNEYEYPLEKINTYDSKYNKVYFRFKPEILQIMENDKMTSLLTGHEIITKKVRDKDYQRIPVNPNVLSIFKKLLKVQENGKQLFTNHELPTDEHHYTNLFGTFQDAMLSLYEGRFLTKYSSEKMDEWFRNKYKYYLNPEKQKEAIRNCKNDWDEIKKLVINSANNYSKWFNIDTEQYNKRLLPRSIIDWIYNIHTKTSMFYVSLLIPPSSAREADADKMYNSIPSKIRSIFSPIYREEFDGFTFWNKINNLEKWYKRYANKLLNKDSNCSYWLGSGITNFLYSYKEWLLGFTDDKPFLKNIGIDNSTFDLYIKTKKQEHGIEIDIPRSL